MFLSRIYSRMPVLGGLMVGAVFLTTAGRGLAQQPNNNVSKFDRANAGVAVAGYWAAPQVAVAPPAVAPHSVTYGSTVHEQPLPGPLVVTVTMPKQTQTLMVDVRGPDGELRTYPVEGGLAGIQTRQVIVRQGETASFRILAAAAPK